MDRDPEIFAGTSASEYQPDIEPPHIPDYAQLKVHKHYKNYFRGHVYVPYPAMLYHRKLNPVIVSNKAEMDSHLAQGFRAEPFDTKVPATGPGKTIVSGSPQQNGSTAELMAAILQQLRQSGPSATTETGLKQAMAADPDYAQFLEFKKWKEGQAKPEDQAKEPAEETAEDPKQLLLSAAEEKGIKVDKRWGLDRLKEELEKYAA